MLSAIGSTLGNLQYPTLQQDDAVAQRRKRSIDADQPQTLDFSGPAANDRRKGNGGLDSLGQGRLL